MQTFHRVYENGTQKKRKGAKFTICEVTYVPASSKYSGCLYKLRFMNGFCEEKTEGKEEDGSMGMKCMVVPGIDDHT